VQSDPAPEPAGNAAAAGGLPVRFRERLAAILPADRLEACWATFHRPRGTAFRVNRLLSESCPLLAELRAADLHPEPIPWLPEAYTVPPAERRPLTESAACGEGRLYIQNPSSLIPSLVLEPRPEDRILDLCAAPGGTTLHLAALTGEPEGIAAVEAVRTRFFRLKRNLASGGAAAVRTYLRDGAGVWRHCPEEFDRVLLDAPCSAEGLIDAAQPDTYADWSERRIRLVSRRQARLLFSAVQCLKPGGILVYSTCTLAPEENERVVDQLLHRFPDQLRVEPLPLPIPDVQPGLTTWQDRALDPSLHQAGRIVPDGLFEAFFVCRLRKTASTIEERLGEHDDVAGQRSRPSRRRPGSLRDLQSRTRRHPGDGAAPGRDPWPTRTRG
jgi:16S rRNA (cytosine1407-C5)-methyltransferase